MAAPVLPRVKLTGAAADGELPLQFLTKLDAADQALLAYTATVESDVSALKRAAYPAGVVIGTVAMAFTYTAQAGNPTGAVSRGSQAIAGSGADLDGRASIAFLTGTRLGVMSVDNFNTTSNTFRISGFDIAAGGALTALGSTLHGSGNGSTNNANIFGLGRLSDTQFRSLGYLGSAGSGIYVDVLATTSFDAAGTATTVVDAAPSRSGSVTPTAAYYAGTTKKVGYTFGQFGLCFPHPATVQAGANIGGAPGMMTVERNSGSTYTEGKSVGPRLGTQQFAQDQLSSSMLIVLSDGYSPGNTAFTARLSIANVNDNATGAFDALPIGNAMAGNPRVCTVSPSLVVFGFLTGSQYGSYAAAVGANNALSLIGAFSSAGGLGTSPVDYFRLKANRIVEWVKGATTVLTGYVYDVDLNAASGVSPFSAPVATLNCSIGADVTGGTAGDAVSVFAMIQHPTNADRFIVVGRNTTRAINFVVAVDLTY